MALDDGLRARWSRSEAGALAAEITADHAHRSELAWTLAEGLLQQRMRQEATQEDMLDYPVGVGKALSNFVLGPTAASAAGLAALGDILPGSLNSVIRQANIEQAGDTLTRIISDWTMQPSNQSQLDAMNVVNWVPEKVFGAYEHHVAEPMADYITQEFGVPDWASLPTSICIAHRGCLN